MSKAGAEAAFKGYSSQTLYILHRVLTDEKDLTFQPETKEDLAVYDSNDKLIEVVQVKDLVNDFCLSDFGSDFFNNRLSEYLQNNIPIILLSFGKIGPELTNAVGGVTKDETSVQNKLINKGFSNSEAKKFLSLLSIQEVDRNNLRRNIKDKIRKTPGVLEEQFAYELLTQWIYHASEKMLKLTKKEIHDKIFDAIVSYNRAYSYLKTIGTNVSKIFDDSLLPITSITSKTDEYNEQFFQGMSARKEHIVAGIDIQRPEKIVTLNELFAKSNIVIIHGASGQGKSCLAYRYLHDYCATPYEITDYNSETLSDIISTLKNLAMQDCNIQIPLYIDVLPGQSEWVKVLTGLFSYTDNYKIIVTIREEEWNSTPVLKSNIQFQELALGFDKDEAYCIFKKVEESKDLLEIPTFEDAWHLFGGNGPLLEFVYLLKQGKTLHDRLYAQIADLTSDEKKLLRLISFTGQFSSKVNTMKLFSTSGIDEFCFTKILETLNNEHFIRIIDEKQITSLHPIRATIIFGLLRSELTDIQSIAIQCLDILSEETFELFLKSLFYEFGIMDELLNKLHNRKYQSWISVCGVIRALHWLGIKQYVKENMSIIATIKEEHGQGWQLFFPVDFMELSTFEEGWLPLLKKENLPMYDKAMQIKNDLSAPSVVFKYAQTFLSEIEETPEQKITDSFEQECLAETLYWLGFSSIEKHIINLIDIVNMSLSIPSIAKLSKGLYHYSKELWNYFFSDREEITNRFQSEYTIVLIEEIKGDVILHCLNPEGIKPPEGESNFVHWMVMERIKIAHLLFPDKERYCAETYGFNLEYCGLNNLNITKHIPKDNLRTDWSTYINRHFPGLVNESSRPANWEYFFDRMKKFFELCGEIQCAFITIIERYLSKKETSFIDAYSSLCEKIIALNSMILLPKETVDKFGGFTEITAQKFRTESIGLEFHKPLLNETKNYQRHIDNSLTQIVKVLMCIIILKDKKHDDYKRLSKLALHNLKDAILSGCKLEKVIQSKYSKYYKSTGIELYQGDSVHLFVLYEFILKKKNNSLIKLNTVLRKEAAIITKLEENLPKQLKRQNINASMELIADNRCIIIADTNDMGTFGNVFKIVTTKLRNVIGQHPLTSIRRVCLLKEIEEFIIIPLYKTKLPMEHFVFALSVDILFDNERFDLNSVYNISFEGVPSEITVERWTDEYNQLKKIEEIVDETGKLQKVVNEFSEMVSLGANIPDENIGNKIFSKIFNDSIGALPIQKCLDIIVSLIDELSNLSDKENIFIYSFVDFEQLSEFVEVLLPPNHDVKDEDDKINATITLNDFTAWALQLNDNLPGIRLALMTIFSCLLSMYEMDQSYGDYLESCEEE